MSVSSTDVLPPSQKGKFEEKQRHYKLFAGEYTLEMINIQTPLIKPTGYATVLLGGIRWVQKTLPCVRSIDVFCRQI
jgi:hypothetical protein